MSVFRDISSKAKSYLKGVPVAERLNSSLSSKILYSQFGEDVHIRSFYERLAFDRGIKVAKGCIVDIGAFHPMSLSNTYSFYKAGWHCINIDPSPGSMKLFNAIRPKDTNLKIAIASEEREALFYTFGNPSVWNTLDAGAAAEASKKLGCEPTIERVEVRRLDEVLETHLCDRAFEVLLIDAEGLDVDILQSNDWDIYQPRLVLVEVHNVTASTLPENPVVQYLCGLGYALHSWINPNLLFVRADSTLDAAQLAPAVLKAVDPMSRGIRRAPATEPTFKRAT